MLGSGPFLARRHAGSVAPAFVPSLVSRFVLYVQARGYGSLLCLLARVNLLLQSHIATAST